MADSQELGQELIRRNREIAEVRDNLLRTEDFLNEARARSNELLEKNSLNEAERTRAEAKTAELEDRCRMLEAAKETATRQLVEERLKGDEATRELREKLEMTEQCLKEARSREEELQQKAKTHADQILVLESKLEAGGRSTDDARLAASRNEAALQEASSRASEALLRVKELESELQKQGSRATEELQVQLQAEEARRLQADANVEVERTRAEILVKESGDAKAEIKRLQNQLQELRFNQEELTSEMESQKAARKQAEEKSTRDNESQLTDLIFARERAETEAAQQREKAVRFAAEADELRRRLEADSGRLDEVRRGSDEMRQVLADVQNKLLDAEARAEAAGPRTTALEEQLSSQQVKCQALTKELDLAHEEKERYVREKDQESATVVELQAKITSLEADLAGAKKLAESATLKASEERKLDTENASLRDELSATRVLVRQQSDQTLEVETLRAQLAEARKAVILGGGTKLEVETLQARICALEAQLSERDTCSRELQQKFDTLEGAKRCAQEEVVSMRSKMNALSGELSSALGNSAKAMQQRSEAQERAAMAKAENDIVRIERAVETQKLRGALEELRFAIKSQVASGLSAQRPSFQPQPRVRAF